MLGSLPDGRQKWYGALRGRDGCIYGVPYKARGVLKINPFTDTVSVIYPTSGMFSDDYKWHGGALGPDGAIYAFPAHASTVLKIIPHRDDAKVQLIELELDPAQDPELMQGRYKWLGGGVDREGNIYGMPSDSRVVLKVQPATGRVTTFGGLLPDMQNKWQGAVCGGDGCLYAIPANACSVLKIDPYTETIELIGDLPKGRDKWQGGFVGSDGIIYGIPENCNHILRLEPCSRSSPVPQQAKVSTIHSNCVSAPDWDGFKGPFKPAPTAATSNK